MRERMKELGDERKKKKIEKVDLSLLLLKGNQKKSSVPLEGFVRKKMIQKRKKQQEKKNERSKQIVCREVCVYGLLN